MDNVGLGNLPAFLYNLESMTEVSLHNRETGENRGSAPSDFDRGGMGPVVTFFPGVVLGWLFIRTEGLLASMLFHGSANVFYVLLAEAFAHIWGQGGGGQAAQCPIIYFISLGC